MFARLPSYEVLKVPHIVDKYGKTPLHYLLAQNRTNVVFIYRQNAVKYILDYLEDKTRSQYECKIITDSLSPLLPILLMKLGPSLSLRFMEFIYKETLPIYGNILPITGKNPNILFKTSPDHVLQPQVIRSIHSEGQRDVFFKTLMFQADYSITSDDMLKMVLTLSELDNTKIYETEAVSNLIAYLWKPMRIYHLTTAALYSIMMSLLMSYFINGDMSRRLDIPIAIFSGIFFILEIIQMISLRWKYFTHFWNCVDAVFFPMILSKMIRCFNGDASELNGSWAFTFIFLVGFLRWVSYLQIFEQTSKI